MYNLCITTDLKPTQYILTDISVICSTVFPIHRFSLWGGKKSVLCIFDEPSEGD